MVSILNGYIYGGGVKNTFTLQLGDSSKCLLPLSLMGWPDWNPGVQWAAVAAPFQRQVLRPENGCGWRGPWANLKAGIAPAGTLFAETCYILTDF